LWTHGGFDAWTGDLNSLSHYDDSLFYQGKLDIGIPILVNLSYQSIRRKFKAVNDFEFFLNRVIGTAMWSKHKALKKLVPDIHKLQHGPEATAIYI